MEHDLFNINMKSEIIYFLKFLIDKKKSSQMNSLPFWECSLAEKVSHFCGSKDMRYSYKWATNEL